MCDAFEEERLKKAFTTGYETDTILFSSGSADILPMYKALLDSVPIKLRSKQDLITLYGYADKNGNDNEALGASRNEAIRRELVFRSVDTAG
jgi:outer membrane protein OmpA-like peptidoglycan-associated protein